MAHILSLESILSGKFLSFSKARKLVGDYDLLWYNKQVKKYIKLHESADLRRIGPNAQVVICQQR
jgi:hypothetical protein